MRIKRKKLEKATTNKEYNKILKYSHSYEYDCGVASICRFCNHQRKQCLLNRTFQRTWKVHRKTQYKSK